MIARPNPTVAEFIERTYQPQHLLKRSTLAFYQGVARSLATFALEHGYSSGPLRLSELSEELVLAWRTRDVERRAAATLNSRRGAILSVWRFAYQKGLAHEPPSIRKLKQPKRRPTAWTLAQMEALVAACYAARSGRGWEGRHWVALALVIYDTALRIGAVLKLRLDQLDAELGCLRVEAEQQKDNEDAAYSLHPQTLGCLAAALADGPRSRRDLLFPWPFGRRKLWRDFDAIVAAARLPNTRRDKFHRIRRTSASWLESVRPGAAQAHLGHSDASTTLVYLDPEITGACVHAAAILPRFALPSSERQALLF